MIWLLSWSLFLPLPSLSLSLDKSCSLELTFDPVHPTRCPNYRLLGEEKLSDEFHRRIEEHIERGDWHQPHDTSNVRDDFIRDNLLRVLDLTELPMPTALNKEEFNLECMVCTMYLLDDVIPEVICTNPLCRRAFHRTCIIEWLTSLSTTQDVFNTLHGQCPVCFTKIIVKKSDWWMENMEGLRI